MKKSARLSCLLLLLLLLELLLLLLELLLKLLLLLLLLLHGGGGCGRHRRDDGGGGGGGGDGSRGELGQLDLLDDICRGSCLARGKGVGVDVSVVGGGVLGYRADLPEICSESRGRIERRSPFEKSACDSSSEGEPSLRSKSSAWMVPASMRGRPVRMPRAPLHPMRPYHRQH